MEDRPDPVQRQSLPEELAHRVRQLIQQRGYRPGDRLPSMVRLARDFGVAHPTLREALRRLEMLGAVEIRHGAGVFVGSDDNPLLITNPIHDGALPRQLLLDMVEARISIELTCAAGAAENASPAQLAALRQALERAERGMESAAAVSEANRGFHRDIARASGNVVMHQLLDALSNAMREEQRIVNHARPTRERFHAEHLAILDALERRDPAQAAERMRAHLYGVREALLRAGPPDTDRTS